MNSESWTMERGSTIEARDFVERFPLQRTALLARCCSMEVDRYIDRKECARLFPLQRGQRVLDLVILRVLEPDVVVDTRSFLGGPISASHAPFIVKASSLFYLRQQIEQFRQRLVRPILDLIPREGAEILINGLCKRSASYPIATDNPLSLTPMQ